MYPPIYCILKCLIFRYLLKIDNISAKIDILSYLKSLEIRKIAVPLQKFLEILKAKTQAETEKCVLGFMPFVLMLYKNGKKGLILVPANENKRYLIIFELWQI